MVAHPFVLDHSFHVVLGEEQRLTLHIGEFVDVIRLRVLRDERAVQLNRFVIQREVQFFFGWIFFRGGFPLLASFGCSFVRVTRCAVQCALGQPTLIFHRDAVFFVSLVPS